MISITMDASNVIAYFRRVGNQLPVNLAGAMERIGAGLQAYIIETKLSGQVLDQKTGKLIAAMDHTVEQSGNTVTAIVSNSAPYAFVHEYGGTFTVPAHMSMSRLGKQFSVRTHQATYPERSFMRSSLAEYVDIALDEISAAVGQAIEQ